MCFKKCQCLVGIILGAVLGSIVGYFAFTTLIPGIITAIWVAFGIAAFSILALILLSITGNKRIVNCVCDNGDCLLLGALATIIISIILLSITLVVGVLGTAILVGLGTMSLVITIVSLADLTFCLVNSTCACRE